MQTRLLLNKKVIFSVVLAVLVILLLSFQKQHEIATKYHVSEWNHYVPDVEHALKDTQPFTLNHVYGMVVPHHIPNTIPQLVEYYSRLKKTQTVKNIIIIGPDHNNSGKGNITVSNASFVSFFGELKPMIGLPEKLHEQNIATIEEDPFDPEHSIGSQMLVIGKIFPEVRVTPIIFKSHTTPAEAQILGRTLAKYLDETTVLVASVDFSHYLPSTQAAPIDAISGEVIKNLSVDDLSLVKADSGMTMTAFVYAMNEKKAQKTDAFQVLNSADLRGNPDYTTGYVFGVWGKE